jgi:hypothetical protein
MNYSCQNAIFAETDTRIVNFWSKLVNCENSKLSSIIYKYAYLQHTQNGLEMPWIKAVKNILDGKICNPLKCRCHPGLPTFNYRYK